MSVYTDYLDQIQVRKGQGLHPKPIEDAELVEALIAQIEDVGHEHRADSLNFFMELTIQKRIEDEWYADVMEECRYGALTQESYNFLVGRPTEHTGSWRADGTLECESVSCAALLGKWKRMAESGESWPDMQAMECSRCSAERDRRN